MTYRIASVLLRADSSRYGRQTLTCAVPTGLGVIMMLSPALKRWAKLFRAYGARLMEIPKGGTFTGTVHACVAP